MLRPQPRAKTRLVPLANYIVFIDTAIVRKDATDAETLRIVDGLDASDSRNMVAAWINSGYDNTVFAGQGHYPPWLFKMA